MVKIPAPLLIKGALLIGAAALAIWAARKAAGAASNAAGQAWDAAKEGAWAVTPWNNENIVYQTVNNGLFPDGSDTLGTWLYGALHPAPEPAPYVPDSPAWNTQGGKWNNPSAYTAPTGQGGAAFGIYPRP